MNARGPVAGMNLLRVDLQLLRVFVAVFDEQSVTRAGARLNITPSAVSHSLSRLRSVFDDDLFIRQGAEMHPTARAADVGPRLRRALIQLEEALQASSFDPATTMRQFGLTVPAYICRYLLPPVMQRFCDEAPNGEIRIIPREPSLQQDFASGHVDLAILPTDQVAAEFGSETLFVDEWVWAVSKAHPLPEPTMSIEQLARLRHVAVSDAKQAHQIQGLFDERMADGENRVEQALQAALAARSLTRKVSLYVPDSLTALSVVALSDHAALVPRRMVTEAPNSDRFNLFSPPYAVPRISVSMIWRRENEAEAGGLWLRNLFKRVVKDLTAQQAAG